MKQARRCESGDAAEMVRGSEIKSGAQRRAQTEARTGHHIHRCSALKQPHPQSGQSGSPTGVIHPASAGGMGNAGRACRKRAAAAAPCVPRQSTGSRAHAPSASHGPAQETHQDNPGEVPQGGAQERALGAAQSEHVGGGTGGRGARCRPRPALPGSPEARGSARARHRVLPGKALERNLRI